MVEGRFEERKLDENVHEGGGDVATFRYHIIDSSKPFTVEGLEITPLPVHHGIYMNNNTPYWCLGFRFGSVSYVSDTNFIPEATEELIRGSEVIVLDALREESHPSHFSISQALDAARRLRPQRTYFVGWSHINDHFELEDRFRALEREEDKLWVRPAFDGLRNISGWRRTPRVSPDSAESSGPFPQNDYIPKRRQSPGFEPSVRRQQRHVRERRPLEATLHDRQSDIPPRYARAIVWTPHAEAL
ncbi:hypothetical protein BC937DRAFT_94071 [Endogone sp. FLAS-F59071]|nr:hypothetical protein BC937DRAFT_94071 [Endogone sp. FLAS-F59071]|eukprot:RUS14269.1 hypothetical protein BC937DRAFT_94071 [Endogone sp. FLAS-F59071]